MERLKHELEYLRLANKQERIYHIMRLEKMKEKDSLYYKLNTDLMTRLVLTDSKLFEYYINDLLLNEFN